MHFFLSYCKFPKIKLHCLLQSRNKQSKFNANSEKGDGRDDLLAVSQASQSQPHPHSLILSSDGRSNDEDAI